MRISILILGFKGLIIEGFISHSFLHLFQYFDNWPLISVDGDRLKEVQLHLNESYRWYYLLSFASRWFCFRSVKATGVHFPMAVFTK